MHLLSLEILVVLNIGVPLVALAIAAFAESIRQNEFSLSDHWQALDSLKATRQYHLFEESTGTEKLAA